MFTGLVQDLGEITALDASGDGVRLAIATSLELAEGDSIAVNGVCLTATAVSEGHFAADVMNETLRRSSLAEVGAGAKVNLELPLRAADRLGGHFVQGHVDAVGRVTGVEQEGESRRLWVAAAPEILRYCVEKGSVVVEGVSLTVAELHDDAFGVALIPHTLEVTTLGSLAPGRKVNLEADVIAKYVERLLPPRPGAPA